VAVDTDVNGDALGDGEEDGTRGLLVPLYMPAFVYMCVDVWMCGCVDVWMCGCVDVCPYAHIYIEGYAPRDTAVYASKHAINLLLLTTLS
jgi:hypothetical protein